MLWSMPLLIWSAMIVHESDSCLYFGFLSVAVPLSVFCCKVVVLARRMSDVSEKVKQNVKIATLSHDYYWDVMPEPLL